MRPLHIVLAAALCASSACSVGVESAPPAGVETPEATAPRSTPAPAPKSPQSRPAETPEAKAGPRVCGAGLAEGPAGEALRAQGAAAGLEHADAFAGVAWTVHRTGRLPDCYLSKRDAQAKGWRRGDPVWRALPGRSIGGDRFGNREGLLPEPQPGGYREADLDDDGGRRGAHRLVFAERTRGRWDLWITTDHYRSFVPVEAP